MGANESHERLFLYDGLLLYLCKAVDLECLGWVTQDTQNWKFLEISVPLSLLPAFQDTTICPPEPQRTAILLWAPMPLLCSHGSPAWAQQRITHCAWAGASADAC